MLVRCVVYRCTAVHLSSVNSVRNSLFESLLNGFVGRQALVDMERVGWNVALRTWSVEHPEFDDAHEEENKKNYDEVQWYGDPDVLEPDENTGSFSFKLLYRPKIDYSLTMPY